MTIAQETLVMFDPERCNQWHGCEVACKIWRELETGGFWSMNRFVSAVTPVSRPVFTACRRLPPKKS